SWSCAEAREPRTGLPPAVQPRQRELGFRDALVVAHVAQAKDRLPPRGRRSDLDRERRRVAVDGLEVAHLDELRGLPGGRGDLELERRPVLAQEPEAIAGIRQLLGLG